MNNTFRVIAENQSKKNVYVDKVELNGEELTEPFISHEAIMSGGELKFYMTAKPNKTLFIN